MKLEPHNFAIMMEMWQYTVALFVEICLECHVAWSYTIICRNGHRLSAET